MRYSPKFELYAVSADRRDGNMIIKKKCAGGTSNGGTYYDLNDFSAAPIPFGQWQHVHVTVRDQPDGSVTITADRDGHKTEATTYTGIGCAPLHGGGVGVRGDDAELRFASISVQSISGRWSFIGR